MPGDALQVPMLQLLQSKPSVHHAFLSAPDQVALAASYLCTRLRGASARAVPLQVYLRPRCSTSAPCTSREHFAALLSRSTQERPVTTSLQGRVVQVSNVFRAAHAVLSSCQACGCASTCAKQAARAPLRSDQQQRLEKTKALLQADGGRASGRCNAGRR